MNVSWNQASAVTRSISCAWRMMYRRCMTGVVDVLDTVTDDQPPSVTITGSEVPWTMRE